MANSNEESLRALNPNVNPTSEVGSSPSVTLEQLMKIMNQMTQPREQKSSMEPKDVTLSRFDPEGTGADPFAWCSYTDVILKDYPMQDSVLLSALNRALKGSAAH
ncbi:uncharacterized protein LOC143303264 [Bombus vancouverensis nearcticus]